MRWPSPVAGGAGASSVSADRGGCGGGANASAPEGGGGGGGGSGSGSPEPAPSPAGGDVVAARNWSDCGMLSSRVDSAEGRLRGTVRRGVLIESSVFWGSPPLLNAPTLLTLPPTIRHYPKVFGVLLML